MWKQIWEFLKKQIWPLLWPIIRDSIVEVVREVIEWIKTSLRRILRERTEQQTRFAERNAQDAERRAETTTDETERIRQTAAAEAWRKVATELQTQNESLKAQLDEALTEAAKYATDRVDAEATRTHVAGRFFTLPSPSDSPDQSPIPQQCDAVDGERREAN